MDNINPRSVLSHLFLMLEGYPPNYFKIIVHTDLPTTYVISVNFGKYEIATDENKLLPAVKDVKGFLNILKNVNERIVGIQLENVPRRNRQPTISMWLFRCEHGACYDLRNKNIQSEMDMSSLSNKIRFSPQNLLAENPDYFKELSFGKKKRSPIPKSIKNMCKKLKIKLTRKVNDRRIYKSVTLLKKQIKSKLKK